MHRHHHLILIAKIALAVGAAVAVSRMQRPGNGLVAPTPPPFRRPHPSSALPR